MVDFGSGGGIIKLILQLYVLCVVLCKFGTMVTTSAELKMCVPLHFSGGLLQRKYKVKNSVIIDDPAHRPLKFELFSLILLYLSMVSLIHGII